MDSEPDNKNLIQDADPESGRRSGSQLGAGIAIGLSLGVALGLVFDSLPLGIGIGLAIGVAIGAAFEQRKGSSANVPRSGVRLLMIAFLIGLLLLLAVMVLFFILRGR